jgi:hypothetical protein
MMDKKTVAGAIYRPGRNSAKFSVSGSRSRNTIIVGT